MKRWPLRVGLFLLLGAIINVAVAWGCTWCSLPARVYKNKTTGDDQSVDVHAYGWLPTPSDQYYEFVIESESDETFGFEITSVVERPHSHGDIIVFDYYPLAQHIFSITKAGWPTKALNGEMWTNYRAEPVTRSDYAYATYADFPEVSNHLFEIAREISISGFTGKIRESFPWRPAWPGFAIDTTFYAAILWMLFAFPFALRRRRRIKRGLCPACAYPVGDSAVCSECGIPSTGPSSIRTLPRGA